MDLDLDAPAGELLGAEVVAPPSAGRWAAVRMFLGAAMHAVFHPDPGSEPGADSPTVSGFLVITRRDTGATLLRTSTDTADPEMLEYVQRQLDELTAGEFLDRWGIDTGGPEDDARTADHTGDR